MNSRINTLEEAKPRFGTRCQFCGELILDNNYIKCFGGALGNVIYAHKECANIKNYSWKNIDTFHKPTYSGFQFGLELETNTATTPEQRLFLRACYSVVSTRDCTVEEEFKSGIIQGCHGIKPMLEGISKVIDIYNGNNCGSHINFSLAKWDNNFRNLIRGHERILTEYSKHIYSLSSSERIAMFGRDFTEYSKYTDRYFEHGYHLAIKEFGLEMRLARAKNVEQYSQLVMFCKEFALILDSVFESKISDDLAIKRIKTLVNNHLQGKAKYQAEYRNNGKYKAE